MNLWPQDRSTDLRVLQECSRDKCDWGVVCVGYSCSRVGQSGESYCPPLCHKGECRSPGDTGCVQRGPKVTTDLHALLSSSPTKAHHPSLPFSQSLTGDQTAMACRGTAFPVSMSLQKLGVLLQLTRHITGSHGGCPGPYTKEYLEDTIQDNCARIKNLFCLEEHS